MIISLEQFSQLTSFDSRAGFLGMANAMDLLLVGPNPGWWSATIFEISNADRSETGHPINFMFDSSHLLTAASKSAHIPLDCIICDVSPWSWH